MALCLRYFGYYYVVALPTIDFDEYGNAVYGAVDYVIDEAGNRYVCDFSKGTYGWMINASYVDIVVDDIGQDLSDANYLGLTVNTSEDTLVTGEDYSGYYEQDETYAGDYGYDTSGVEEGSTGDYEDYGVTGGQEEEATTGTTETYGGVAAQRPRGWPRGGTETRRARPRLRWRRRGLAGRSAALGNGTRSLWDAGCHPASPPAGRRVSVFPPSRAWSESWCAACRTHRGRV